MASGPKAADELVDDLYEEVLSEERAARVAGLPTARKAEVEPIPSDLMADHLARAIHAAARVALSSVHGENNTKDGKVTPGEIKNYAHGNGTLQQFAEQIVWYAANKKK